MCKLQMHMQAFAAVQASVVHLQGVPLSKRFALVPLGPPLLSYSSTSKVSPLERNFCSPLAFTQQSLNIRWRHCRCNTYSSAHQQLLSNLGD